MKQRQLGHCGSVRHAPMSCLIGIINVVQEQPSTVQLMRVYTVGERGEQPSSAHHQGPLGGGETQLLMGYCTLMPLPLAPPTPFGNTCHDPVPQGLCVPLSEFNCICCRRLSQAGGAAIVSPYVSHQEEAQLWCHGCVEVPVRVQRNLQTLLRSHVAHDGQHHTNHLPDTHRTQDTGSRWP